MGSVSQNNKGFTLMEIFMAILIFSIVVFTLFSTWSAFMKSGQQVIQEVKGNEGHHNAISRITMDLEQLFVIHPPRYEKPRFDSDPDPYRFEGREVNNSAGTFPYISFASFAHLQTGFESRPGVARIAYYVKADKNNLLNLYRADNLAPFPEDETSCADPVLLQNISKFEVRYLDQNGDEHRYWDSDSKEFNHMFPSKVNLRILFKENEQTRVVGTTIPVYAYRNPME